MPIQGRARLLGLALCCLAFAPRMATASCPPSQLFTPYFEQIVGTGPFTLLTIDVDRDGILDLVAVDNGASGVGVALGNGDGTFRSVSVIHVSSGPGQISAADFNGDSLVEFVVNSSGTDAVTVLIGHGDGTFTATPYGAGSTPYGVTHGDFNGDGRQDIAVANFLANTVSVLLGLPSGGFAGPVSFTAGQHPYFITTGDFHHDGILDLAVSNQDSYDVSILIGRGSGGVGDGTFWPRVNYPVGQYPYSVATGDFNHDGINDFAVANGGSGTVSVLLGNGSAGNGDGTFAAAANYPSGPQPRSVAASDLDGDGITDLAVADYSGNVSLFLGLGSGGVGNGMFASALQFPAGNAATGIAIGDLNRDGLPDLAVANYQSNIAAILLHGCGVPPPPPPSRAPTLTRVRDVPADQGGRVFVTWTGSSLDTAGAAVITGYRVWRRISPETAMSAALATRDPSGDGDPGRPLIRLLYGQSAGDSAAVTYWEALITLPAEALEGYGYTAPTTRDSLPSGNPYTAFFVTALTANPAVFYESNIDSGYSVDNLAPGAPLGVTAVYGSGVALHWSPNPELDVAGYRIYRGPASNASTVDLQLIATQPDTGFVDPSGTLAYAYGLGTVDIHGNESVRVLMPPPLATATAIAIMGSEVEPNLVHLVWYGDAGAASSVTVYRCDASGAWSAIGQPMAGADGRLEFDDRSVAAGTRYGYRLGVTNTGVEWITGEVWVSTPALAFALRSVAPNPSTDGRLRLSVTLPTDAAVKVDVIDLSGRRVLTQSLGGLGAGSHVVDVTRDARLPGGMYVIRLSQAGRSLSTKTMVFR